MNILISSLGTKAIIVEEALGLFNYLVSAFYTDKVNKTLVTNLENL